MQLSNSPGKLVLPFASSGNKNSIPVNSQIGITPGAASLADGFPPLTMTPVAAGGVPPSGLDVNGILYEMSNIVRWANAGGGYVYDADFATSDDVGGYPKGARVLRADGSGYWLNTVDNNITDPEAEGAAAAGWVPDFTSGIAAVTMTSANVTLTPSQYGKPVIVISGTLTSNLNLIFPQVAGSWIIVNNTNGAYTITCKTDIDVGVQVRKFALLVNNGASVVDILNKTEVNVDDYGAVGNGIADDAAAIMLADAALAKGGTLNFGINKTYLGGITIAIKNAGRINLNGSTVKASSAINAQLLSWQKWLATYVAGINYTAFSVVKNKSTFTIPVGVTISAGNIVKLMSNTDRLTDYKHGVMATIISVTGGVATINRPFYESFQIDSIAVYEGFQQMEIFNGTIDLTAIGSAVAFTEGVLIRGSNAHVRDCIFVGSQYSGIGVRVECDRALIENCMSSGFKNTQGIIGGGRIGYGFAAYGNDSLIQNCTSYDCKHGLAAGARDIVSQNVTYKNCKVYENVDAAASDYTASIDMHANVIGVAEVIGCDVVGKNVLLDIRCDGLRVRGGRYIQMSGPSPIISVFDQPVNDAEISDIEYYLANASSLVFFIGSSSDVNVTSVTSLKFNNCKSLSQVGGFVDFQRNTALTGINIENVTHVGGSLFRHSGGNIAGLNIRKNVVQPNVGAVRIVMDGSLFYANDIVIEDNKFFRSVGTSNENLIIVDSSTATRIAATNMGIRRNLFSHSGDTGTGYSINIFQVAGSFFDISDNKCNRGSFRCISLDGCSITNGIIKGQVIDGSFLVQNNADATVLTNVSFLSNVGDTYTVATNGFGITKTRYVDSGNNFLSYTP